MGRGKSRGVGGTHGLSTGGGRRGGAAANGNHHGGRRKGSGSGVAGYTAPSKPRRDAAGDGGGAVPFPFDVQREGWMEVWVCVVMVVAIVTEYANIYRAQLALYPRDVILGVAVLVSHRPLSWLYTAWQAAMTARLPARVSTAVCRSVLAGAALGVGTLCLRLCVRYSFWTVLATLTAFSAWTYVWQLVVGDSSVHMAAAVRHLPWVFLSAPLFRGVALAVGVLFLPWSTVSDVHVHHDVLPTVVIATLCGLCVVCVDMSSMIAARKLLDARADSDGFLHRQVEQPPHGDVCSLLVAATPYWVMLLPSEALAATPSLPPRLSPDNAQPWDAAVAYSPTDVVFVPSGGGGGDGSRLFYRAVGHPPAGYHPRCLRSRLLQLLFTDPIRVVRTATVLEVILVAACGEFVLLLQRWELYMTVMLVLFLSLVATYVTYRSMHRHDRWLGAAIAR